jgi:CheY-like chemotaxis protein
MILLVDDEPLLRTVVAEELADEGHEVIEAETALEAVTFLRARDDIEVLITDIRMPGALDGLWLARWVAEALPQIHILVISGWYRQGGNDLPAKARFLAKPFAPGRLTREVQAMLA